MAPAAAAAAAFSNHSLPFSPSLLPPTQSLTTTITLALPISRRSSRQSSIPTQRTFVAVNIPRRSFLYAAKVADSGEKIVYGDEENEMQEKKSGSAMDSKSLPPMKTLIQAYKKAILDGDEKIAFEMEAAICTVQDVKNDLALKFAEAQEELDSGKDKFLRLKADFDNFRKRTEKDRLTLTSDIQEELIESLLPMVDSFERARQQIDPVTEKERKMDASYQGIYKQFVEIMRSLQVSVVETVGKPFDPLIHEAIAREESQQFKEGIIIQEIRRGFALRGRLLRSATVRVSTGPGPRKAPSATEKVMDQPVAAAQTSEKSGPTISNS